MNLSLNSTIARVDCAVVGGLFALLLIAFPGASRSQSSDDESASAESTTPPATGPNWLVNCTNTGRNGTLACEMSQSVVLSQSGARVLTATVRAGDDTSKPMLLLTLPHGLYLPAGVALAVDSGKQDPLQIETCDTEGCYLALTIEPALLDGLMKGSKLHLLMQDLQRQEVDLPLTLNGFGASYQTMKN